MRSSGDLREYCRNRGWGEVQEYVDQGISGSKDSRPAWNQVWDLIQKRRVHLLLVHALDRLGRSLPHLVKIISTLTENQITLISFRENIDLGTAAGRMIAGIFSVMADYELSIIKERTKAGMRAAKARGSQIGPVKRFFDKRKATTLRDQGWGQIRIARELGIGVGRVNEWVTAGVSAPATTSQESSGMLPGGFALMNAFRLTVGGRRITSLVMDAAEFASLCDTLGEVRFSSVAPEKHRRAWWTAFAARGNCHSWRGAVRPADLPALPRGRASMSACVRRFRRLGRLTRPWPSRVLRRLRPAPQKNRKAIRRRNAMNVNVMVLSSGEPGDKDQVVRVRNAKSERRCPGLCDGARLRRRRAEHGAGTRLLRRDGRGTDDRGRRCGPARTTRHRRRELGRAQGLGPRPTLRDRGDAGGIGRDVLTANRNSPGNG